MTAVQPDLLRTIVAATRRIVEVRRQREPLERLMRRAARRRPDGERFVRALSRTDRFNVVAECRRRSPGGSVLRPDYDPVALCAAFVANGAAAISVATEPGFFDGALEHLEAVRARTELPVLRRDCIIDEYQLYEAIAAGADAVLLVAAVLEPPKLQALLKRAAALGLGVLVETRSRDEIAAAAKAGARVIGVNNRDPRTLEVNADACFELMDAIPEQTVAVAAGGLRQRAELQRLSEVGYDAFVVGARLMEAPDPGRALSDMVGVW